MTSRHLPECPPFADWYRAVNDRSPFPWQQRLADQVAASSGWPGLVGIPTGLGKTACIDIAIWALAYQAHKSPVERTAPTRLWWVVNRRLLVDNTYNHAQRIAQRLGHETDGPLADVASRLCHITGRRDSGSVPLQVIHMRGGRRRAADPPVTISPSHRPSTPAQPAVICSTIPMFGSRILFRGYGSSRSMRPVDAALAYTDSLVIIDEAHLAVHLQGLLTDLARLDSAEIETLPEARRSPVVVALTATGDPGSQRFKLDTGDYGHPVIRQRLYAAKPVRIEVLDKATTPSRIAEGMVSVVKGLLHSSDPGVSLVFVNSPITARLVAKRLRLIRDTKVVIATGQIRGYEAEKVTAKILDEAGCNVDRVGRDQHLIVVTTQTLEVGADIDANYLVTEACGVRALTQRLGRLNRLGVRRDAEAIYVHTPGKNGSWPVYGEEPAAVLARLQSYINADGVVNLTPETIARVLGDPQDQHGRAPVVAPGILQEWIKTTARPPGEAPVNPYFAGFDDLQRHVNIAWRAYIPEPSQKLWPRLQGDETVEVFLSEATDTLERLDDNERWALLDSRHRGATLDSPQDLRPGNTILIHTDVGLLDHDGHWEPRASNLVLDVSILSSGLPVVPGVLERIYGGNPPKGAVRTVKAIVRAREDGNTEIVEEECHRLCSALRTTTPPRIDRAEWDDFVTDLKTGLDDRMREGRPALIEPRDEVARLPRPRSDTGTKLTIRSDEDDEISVCAEQDDLSLARHGQDTADEASRISDAVGITGSLSYIVTRAARLHDIGKADPRFQISLDRDWTRGSELRAKSRLPWSSWARYRARAGWPYGGRHEELSRRLIAAWLEGTDHGLEPHEANLLQHLVVSHHGHGRPIVPPVRDRTSGYFLAHEIEKIKVTASPNLEIPDWEQPSRFATLNHIYGPWGLALLETIVRQSDHVASSVLEIQ